MNEHLNIPTEVQIILDNINEVPLYLAELPMPDHPKLPQFNRKIRVTGIETKSKNEFIYFTYEQVLYDKETGEKFNMSLPTPEWIVYKDTWSYFRNAQNETIELPLKFPEEESSSELDRKIKVPSYKYMIWLMKNNRVGLLQLIEQYLYSFKESKLNELNS